MTAEFLYILVGCPQLSLSYSLDADPQPLIYSFAAGKHAVIAEKRRRSEVSDRLLPLLCSLHGPLVAERRRIVSIALQVLWIIGTLGFRLCCPCLVDFDGQFLDGHIL